MREDDLKVSHTLTLSYSHTSLKAAVLVGPASKAAEVFFDLLAAAVGEEAAGLGVFVAAEAGADRSFQPGKPSPLRASQYCLRGGRAAGRSIAAAAGRATARGSGFFFEMRSP